jgi:hypothetical protein
MTRTAADWETLQGAIGGADVVPDANAPVCRRLREEL